MNLPAFLKSRKFWAMILGALVVVLREYIPNFPLSDEEITKIALLIVAYIVGTGLQDSSQRAHYGAEVLEMQRELTALRASNTERKP